MSDETTESVAFRWILGQNVVAKIGIFEKWGLCPRQFYCYRVNYLLKSENTTNRLIQHQAVHTLNSTHSINYTNSACLTAKQLYSYNALKYIIIEQQNKYSRTSI